LIAFGNGDPRNIGSVQEPTQKLWRGQAQVIVRSNGARGRISINAESDGLKSARTMIDVR
jgi:hypothetical protein